MTDNRMIESKDNDDFFITQYFSQRYIFFINGEGRKNKVQIPTSLSDAVKRLR